jgi:hypothetical protein
MIDEVKVRQLTQKLKDQGDISLEETDWIYSLVSQKPPDKEVPVAALKDWYEAVGDEIKAGRWGNFVFSIFMDGESQFKDCLRPAQEAIKKNGALEDRICSMAANQKMYSLFPKYFQDLFKWNKYSERYVLHSYRAGFFDYPLREPESNKTYTIFQLLEELSLFPAVGTKNPDTLMISSANVLRYVIIYLSQKMPFLEVNAIRHYGNKNEAIFYTDEEGILATKYALKMPLEELVDNALCKNIIDKNIAKELLEHDHNPEGFPELEFTKASIEYIDERVQRMLKWRSGRKMIEEETGWLEEIR